jgi:hypothetical protein
MERDWGFNRRTLLRSWVVSLLGKRSAASTASAAFDPIAFTLRGLLAETRFERRYRMDATILLLGAPLFTRQCAGGAYASLEIGGDQVAPAVALQFAAGSLPSRAHGLNRFGILREAVVERPGAIEFSFAGLMTRAREESFEQARRALEATPGAAEGMVARGRTAGSGPASTAQTWIENIDLAPGGDWSNLSETLSEALNRQPRTLPRATACGQSTTFLHTMRSAALCREPIVTRQFVHAGKLYQLTTRRRAERPLELDGVIRDLAGARHAQFRTAYAAGDASGLPVRIEYRPRSFLRLTFEVEPEATQPAIPLVFPEENA